MSSWLQDKNSLAGNSILKRLTPSTTTISFTTNFSCINKFNNVPEDFINSNIDTAKDIGEIAGAIDGLFQGVDECQKGRSAHSKLV